MKIIIFIIFIILITLIIFYISYTINRRHQIKDAKEKIKKLKTTIKTNESFNQIPKYYINLDRSLDRRNNIESEIKKYNIKNIERIEAFDGREIINLRKGEIKGYKYVNNSKINNNTKSELAITMSHLKAIKEASNNNYDNVIIMEDDIEFFLLSHSSINFREIVNNLPQECDILLLAHQHSEEFKIISKEEKDVRISGVCYLVTKRGIEKLSKYLNNQTFTFDKSLKNIIWDCTLMNNLNIYHTNKSLFLFYNFKFSSDKDNINKDNFCEDSYKILNSYI